MCQELLDDFSLFPFFCPFGLTSACFRQYSEYCQGSHNSHKDEYDANHLRCFLGVWSKQWFKTEIVRLLELQDVGYQGRCPEPPLLEIVGTPFFAQVDRFQAVSPRRRMRILAGALPGRS